MKKVSIEERLLEIEGTVRLLKSQMDDALLKGYQQAVEEQDEDQAADFARKIRNNLLKRTDSEYALDRLELDFSSPINFTKSLKALKDNAWGKYRQELRDIPQQKGFPFNIKFPTLPEKEKS